MTLNGIDCEFHLPVCALSMDLLSLFLIIISIPVLSNFSTQELVQNSNLQRRALGLAVSFLPAIVITLINVIAPAIFDVLVAAEQYNLEREIQVTQSDIRQFTSLYS